MGGAAGNATPQVTTPGETKVLNLTSASEIVSEITISAPSSSQIAKGLDRNAVSVFPNTPLSSNYSLSKSAVNLALEWASPSAGVMFQTKELQEITPSTLPRLPEETSAQQVLAQPQLRLQLSSTVSSPSLADAMPSGAASSRASSNSPTGNSPVSLPTTTVAQTKPSPANTTAVAATDVITIAPVSPATANTTNTNSVSANSAPASRVASSANSPAVATSATPNTLPSSAPTNNNVVANNTSSSTGKAAGINSRGANSGANASSGSNIPVGNIFPQNSVLVTPSAQNTGLEPVQPLVVPTTPSQVTLERVQKITLREAIELVGRTQRDIIQARIAVEKARGVVQEAEAAKNPTVSGNVTYNFNDSAQTRLSNIANNLRSSTINQPLQGTVGVQYTLFDSGVNDTNIRIAVQTLRSAEADLNRISQVAYLNVATAYYSLQNADGTVTIYEKQVENNERSLKDTKARERAGVGTKFDVLQSEVQLANARQDLLNAQVNQANARRELARLLSYVPTLDIAAADEIKPVDPWDKPVEETILLALRNRSELDARRLEREIARERANLSLARTGPQVSVFANYNLADDLNTIGGFAMGYQLGARLDFTIFDGGRAQAQVRQYKADQALAESRFEQDARQARFDVESSYNTMIGRRQQIDTAEKGLKQAEDALRLSRLRLSAGVGTQLEVISAENDLTRARVNRLQAITGYNQARANLERAINGMPNY